MLQSRPKTVRSAVVIISAANFCKHFTVILMLICGSSYAQSLPTEVDIFQKIVGIEKKAAVGNFMKLDNSNTNFWRLYDEYEAARQNLGKERISIIIEYANTYSNISDEKILELYKRTRMVREAFGNLQATYFKKMIKEVGTKRAAQFWQLENYFNAMIQAEIYSNVPFIGESLKK